MKWQLPAKTFLVGEYAAIEGHAALLLTTTPCFELEVTHQAGMDGIHPDSPAGQLWQAAKINEKGLQWRDPYQGKGGLGASSAQFIGCYKAISALENKTEDLRELLELYDRYAFNGQGLKPSGYDIIAQYQHGCVYIDKKNDELDLFNWPFKEIGFLLAHTGKKLATHEHLQQSSLPKNLQRLAQLSQLAKKALLHTDSQQLLDAINQYHQQLLESNLVAEHSKTLINDLKNNSNILAIKGCGALGADILLIIGPIQEQPTLIEQIKEKNLELIATQNQLFMPQNPTL